MSARVSLARPGGLRLFGRIDGYVGGLFMAAYATSFLLVVGLVLIFDLASNLDWFEPWEDGGRAPTGTVLRYYLLQVPFLYLQVAPFVTVVAGLFTVSRLSRNNEIVAALAAGISARRVLLMVFLGGLAAAGGMFLLREVATETLGFKRDTLHDLLEHQREERLFENLWFRDDYGNVVRLIEFRPATAPPDGAEPIAEVRGLEVTLQDEGVAKLIRAERAVWTAFPPDAEHPRGTTGWRLEGGVVQEVEDQSRVSPIERLEGVRFSPADVLLVDKGRDRTMELSFGELARLARKDPGNVSFQTLLQYHLTFPLANLVLLLVALPRMIGRERGRHMEGLVEGSLLCIVYFSVDFVARALGMEGSLSPLLASWLPVLGFGSLGVVLLESMRT